MEDKTNDFSNDEEILEILERRIKYVIGKIITVAENDLRFR